MQIHKKIGWIMLASLGSVSLGVIAVSRGEPINAVWLLAAAACVYVLGYRFYSRWVAYRILELDAKRATPVRFEHQ